jgi:hypothetical protein
MEGVFKGKIQNRCLESSECVPELNALALLLRASSHHPRTHSLPGRTIPAVPHHPHASIRLQSWPISQSQLVSDNFLSYSGFYSPFFSFPNLRKVNHHYHLKQHCRSYRSYSKSYDRDFLRSAPIEFAGTLACWVNIAASRSSTRSRCPRS